MARLSNLALAAATLALSACAGRSASTTPSAATLALYEVNAPDMDAGVAPAARRSNSGNSSGAATIGDFVRTRNPQLQFCYEETRAANPTLAGSATIGVLLAPDGRVSRADVLRRSWEGKGAEKVEDCVLAKVRSWKFPAEDGAPKRVHSFSVIFTR
ncbi:MAG TPA: AgmX/PglI C-terminal domain-containing protein [Gemmatimonadaceae bacterium]|nr:AgmX/PglI C-terminal domain-containing protein [Gemmatimonadaceae bacterium]